MAPPRGLSYPAAFMKVSVIGTGYVGLVAAAGFADYGNDIVCADIDASKIERLNRGEIPIYEPGLDVLVERNVKEGRLRFTTSNAEAAKHGDVVFLAVGTPSSSDGSANLRYLFEAASELARHLDHDVIVVNKSTVPVGTAERVARIMGELTSHKVTVASNPEFLKEGTAVEDFMRPDRVVLGTTDPHARETLQRLYKPFFRQSVRILCMDARSAEITKYACNAYLATRVSFINDIANLCDLVGADVELVRSGMGMDPRIGNKFLYPGCGYGGSCFPKDTRALINTAREHGLSLSLVAAAERINETQKLLLVRKTRQLCGDVSGKTIAVWGLAFKPNTDDVREAPALRVVRTFLNDGAKLRLHDPEAGPNFLQDLGDTTGATVVDDPYEAVEGADALILTTEWRQYRSPDFERLKSLMKPEAAIIDGRNQWDRKHLEALGFRYTAIGR